MHAKWCTLGELDAMSLDDVDLANLALDAVEEAEYIMHERAKNR